MPGSFSQADDLSGATFERVNLNGASFSSCWIEDVSISGEVESLSVNGVDVVVLVEAELDGRHPERRLLRPALADAWRAAWPVIETMWAATVERARALDESLLHERVGGEWSFIETQRHLLYATDTWIGRVVLGAPRPWHPLALPFDQLHEFDTDSGPWALDARPSLDEVLDARASRMATVRSVLESLTNEQLAGRTTPVDGPGWPGAEPYPMRGVLQTILDEEWWHHRYAVRDLAQLEARERAKP